MKVTLDVSKREAELLCEALNLYRRHQRDIQKECKDANPSRFTTRINIAFALESKFQEIVFN